MLLNIRCVLTGIAIVLILSLSVQEGRAQSFGVELHNTLMPASGAMGGASLARPQDVQSTINGNPATMARLGGTQFGFSGAWVEPTVRIRHAPPAGGILPKVGAFEAKSNAQGSALGNIAVTQDMREFGVPATMGVALISSSGLGVSYRGVPESNGTSATLQFLQITAGVGMDLTEQLSVGANMMLGSGTLDGPFVGLTGAAYDYALRGAVGLSYDLGPCTTLGVYYQSIQSYTFDDAAILDLPGGGSIISDIDADLPDNIGIGIANESLMDGRLLLAADILYKRWDNADLFKSIYDDQWVFQFGAQYTVNPRVRVRIGYVFAENAMQANPGNSAGGVTPPGGQAALNYVQAQFAAINKHRISGGIGIRDVLPNIDFDLFAGGMLENSQDFGAFTSVSVESYWIGTGMTWNF